MPAFATLLLLAALVLFAIPALRQLFRDGKVDFTNTGLACLAAALLLG